MMIVKEMVLALVDSHLLESKLMRFLESLIEETVVPLIGESARLAHDECALEAIVDEVRVRVVC